MAGRRLRHTADQIIAILQEHTGDVTAQEIIRRHGISLDTFYRWKRKYGGVDKPELHRLQALEDENRRVSGDHRGQATLVLNRPTIRGRRQFLRHTYLRCVEQCTGGVSENLGFPRPLARTGKAR